MSERKPDRRVARTKAILSETLIDLILEVGYDKISVRTIVNRANIGRTTFYAHFEDKEALLTYSLGSIEDVVQNSAEIETHLHNLLLHATENPRLFRAFITTPTLHKRMTRWLVNNLQAGWQIVDPAAANFIAGGIMQLLVWWQAEQPERTVDEIMETVRQQLQAEAVPKS